MARRAPAPPKVPTVVKAKPGYVVSSLTIRTTVFLTGLSLTYVKLDAGRLQPEDSYTSEWVGSMAGRSETSGAPARSRWEFAAGWALAMTFRPRAGSEVYQEIIPGPGG